MSVLAHQTHTFGDQIGHLHRPKAGRGLFDAQRELDAQRAVGRHVEGDTHANVEKGKCAHSPRRDGEYDRPLSKAKLPVSIRAEAVNVIVVGHGEGVLSSARHMNALGGRQGFAHQRGVVSVVRISSSKLPPAVVPPAVNASSATTRTKDTTGRHLGGRRAFSGIF